MIVDLFAGMGGWTEGALALGRHDVGVEIDLEACRTRAAAGHTTMRADVSTFPLGRLEGRVEGLIASPPCTDWSQSGKRAGLDGETGALVLEVDRWVRALRPRWVACEQVPPAAEWWHRFAHEWQELGYSTWAGILNAANYGVPQTRRRAILIASLDRRVGPPAATHARRPEPSLFGELLPWVSMATALGWGFDDECSPTVTAGGTGGDGGPEPFGYRGTRERLAAVVQTGDNSHVTSREGSKAGEGGVELYERSINEPAPTLDTGAGGKWRVLHTNRGQDEEGNRQQVGVDRPAPALSTKSGGQWVFDRPATTVQGDPRLWPPGLKINADDERRLGADAAAERYGDRAGTEAIRLTIEDALVLQNFRRDYPVQGNKSKQFEQVGNAVPPGLARAVLAVLLG